MRPPPPSRAMTLAGKTDEWFRRARAALLSQVPCHSGCSHCCVGIFPITRLDVRLLQEGLAHLPTEQRERIAGRAAEEVAGLEAIFPRLQSTPSIDDWSDEEIDGAVHASHQMPCPALQDDGRCAVYAYRPLTCRSMGIPTRQGAIVHGACDVQTFVPITRLSDSLEAEEQALAKSEAVELAALPEVRVEGEELLLPYGFVSSRLGAGGEQDRSAILASPDTERRNMGHHSILIIDDDADIRNALQLVLKRAGYHPLLAESGRAAIELMTKHDQAVRVAAILCDLEMPEMDGATVIAHFHKQYPMIPIIVLSGAAPAQFLDALGQQGVGDWLRKPATNESVLEKVRGAVHLFELRNAGPGSKDCPPT